MEYRGVIILLSLTFLCTRSTTEPVPEHFSLPLAGQGDTLSQPHDSSFSNSEMWQKNLLNASDSRATFLDPLSSADAEELLKNDIRRQAYGPTSSNMGYQFATPGYQPTQNPGFQPVQNMGAQQFPNPGFQQMPTSSYPQIYKLDNIIIIANPTPVQPQSCPPMRPPPPDFPNPNQPGDKEDPPNRIGEDNDPEPTKCTWAIVACCSPNNNQVRYNCFELLGCPGFFFDSSPCDPDVVEAAAESTLKYYRSANRGGSSKNTN